LVIIGGYFGNKLLHIENDSKKIIQTQNTKKDNIKITTTSSTSTTTESTTITTTSKPTTTTKKTTKSTVKKTSTTKKTTKKVTTTVAIDENDPIAKKVRNLKITAVGDSVMLGAVLSKTIQKKWPNGNVDAKTSRSMGKGITLMNELKEKGKLGDPLIVHLGTNGGCSEANLNKIMEIAGDRPVFMLTTTNPKILKINTQIKTVCGNYSNCHVVDWYTYLNEWREENADNLKNGWKDLTYKDGMHLRPEKGKNTKTGEKQPYSGRYLYAKLIYDNVSKYS
jgi:hypothetical protein